MIVENINIIRILTRNIPEESMTQVGEGFLAVSLIFLIILIISLLLYKRLLKRNEEVLIFRLTFLDKFIKRINRDYFLFGKTKYVPEDFERFLWSSYKMVSRFWIKDFRRMTTNTEFYDYIMKD